MSSLKIRSEILCIWYSTVRFFGTARGAQAALLSPKSLIFPEHLNLCSPPGTMPYGPLEPTMWLMRMLASVGRLRKTGHRPRLRRLGEKERSQFLCWGRQCLLFCKFVVSETRILNFMVQYYQRAHSPRARVRMLHQNLCSLLLGLT